MELMGFFLGLLLIFLVLSPFVALAVALRARALVLDLRSRLAALEELTLQLQQRLLAFEKEQAAAAPPAVVAPVVAPTVETRAEPAPPAPQTPATEAGAAPPPGAVTLQTPPTPRVPAGSPQEKAVSLEERVGLTWITRLGAAMLVLGAAYFFKYAVDNQWIGPWGRVSLGAFAGVVLLFAAERVKARAKPAYVHGLLGVGLALLYVSGYAVYGFYRLVPSPVSFGFLLVVAALAVAEAIHHRSQAILVFALLAALANPLLLASGQDRALALFAYLLAVTSIGLAVAVRLHYPVPMWLSGIGTAVVAGAWYAQFFRIDPPLFDPVEGIPIPGTAGAYFPLGARAVPLFFAAAFAAQWVTSGLAARRRGFHSAKPLALVVVGLLSAHGAAGLLLRDHPAELAVAMSVCALAAVVLLRKEDELPWLALPLVVSFFILAGSAEHARPQPGLTLIFAALCLGFYAFALLPKAHAAVAKQLADPPVFLLALVLLAAVVLAGLLLLPAHPQTLVGLMALLGVASAYLARWVRRSWVLGLGAAATFAAVLAANPAGTQVEPGFLWLSAVWGAVYLLAGAHALVIRRLPADLATVVVTAAAPLGFVAVLLAATSKEQSGLRALAAAGAGLATFAVGALTHSRRTDARPGAAVLLGCGVALLAIAVGLALSGVTVTLVWALMGVAVFYLAVRSGEEPWLFGALGLLSVALVRALAVDLPEPARMAQLFVKTYGAKGALRPPLFFNPRALALFGVGGACLTSAYFASRAQRQRVGGVLAVVGYALLLALLVTEVQLLVTSLPGFPGPGLDSKEFAQFIAQVREAEAAQVTRRSVAVTLVFALAGSAVLAGGFACRSALHRWLGLLVLGLAVGKLSLWDIWQLPRLHQVLVLVAVGSLLLGAGFLYARFGDRLRGLWRKGTGALLLLAAANTAGGAGAEGYRFSALLEVPQAGLARFEVPPELYRLSASGPELADLRILHRNGRQVPWFVRDVPAPELPVDQPTELLDPVTLADGATRATFDLGPDPVRHSELELALDGAHFLRLATVEISDDRTSWGTLSRGYVFAVSTAAGESRATTLRYPATAARYVRVTVSGEPGKEPVAIRGGRVRHRPPMATEPAGKIELRLLSFRSDRQKGQSVAKADAGGAGVPLRAIILDVRDPRFERKVTVEAASQQEIWVPVGFGLVFRAGTTSQVRVPVTTTKRYLRITIEDGDNEPLTLEGVRGEYRLQEVIVEAPEAGAYTVLVGCAGARAPHYDLRAFVERTTKVEPATATLRAFGPNTALGAPEPAPIPWTERHRFLFAGLLTLLALALGFWAFRLLHPGGKLPSASDEPPRQ